MTTPLFIILTAFAVSPHCVGMCGTLTCSTVPANRQNNTTFLLIFLGRLSAYILMGAFAGKASQLLFTDSAFASIMLVITLTLFFFYGVILISGKKEWHFWPVTLTKKILSNLIPINSHKKTFLLGLLISLLPCPVIHGVLILALGSGDTISGILVLLLFGFGTAIPMFFAFLFTKKLIHPAGKYNKQIAGLLILASVMFSIHRFSSTHASTKVTIILNKLFS